MEASDLISIGMIAYFHIYCVGLMDKPSPVYARRSAAGISHDASERSASISQASRIRSFSHLCGLCFGELHHRNKAGDPGGASGAPPGSTCPDQNASPRRRPFLHHRKDTTMQGEGSFCPSPGFIFMKRQLPDEAESRFKRRRREKAEKKNIFQSIQYIMWLIIPAFTVNLYL